MAARPSSLPVWPQVRSSAAELHLAPCRRKPSNIFGSFENMCH